MRRAVLLLMIALVPLRMWAAGGMALQMAQAELVQRSAVVSASSEAMPADCPMTAHVRGDKPPIA